ncbi:MAG: hypothetical protein SH857_08290 [Chitinophagales bacterium]|nr:hypothetical protein [Chitinophagales bacterium]
MLRESDKLTDTLIQIIQSLSETKRKKIARNITGKSKLKSKAKRKIRDKKDKFKQFSDYLDSLGSRLPKDYKFNREEANER